MTGGCNEIQLLTTFHHRLHLRFSRAGLENRCRSVGCSLQPSDVSTGHRCGWRERRHRTTDRHHGLLMECAAYDCHGVALGWEQVGPDEDTGAWNEQDGGFGSWR